MINLDIVELLTFLLQTTNKNSQLKSQQNQNNLNQLVQSINIIFEVDLNNLRDQTERRSFLEARETLIKIRKQLHHSYFASAPIICLYNDAYSLDIQRQLSRLSYSIDTIDKFINAECEEVKTFLYEENNRCIQYIESIKSLLLSYNFGVYRTVCIRLSF